MDGETFIKMRIIAARLLSIVILCLLLSFNAVAQDCTSTQPKHEPITE